MRLTLLGKVVYNTRKGKGGARMAGKEMANDVELVNHEGKNVKLSSFWENQNVVLAFLRHLG